MPRTVNDDFANPLRRLPGVLALPALAAAAAARLATGSEANLAAALRLDPLALLRALRTAATPALADAAPATGLPTAQSLVRELGVEAVRRLFAARAAGPVDDLRVRAVWLRSLGLAHAARACALRSATFDPEAAYLLGLLANLPDWLATLASAATAADLGQCLAAWNLPAAVRNALAGDDPAWNGVLAAARALDIDDGSRQERADAVHGQLAAFDLHDGARATAHPARRATDGGAPTTAVQSLLRCSRFDRYRNVIGGLMAAARDRRRRADDCGAEPAALLAVRPLPQRHRRPDGGGARAR